MRFALVHNPRSRRNRTDPTGFVAEASRRLGPFFVHAQGEDALLGQIAELARHSVPTIAVNGGDGTVSHVLTAVARAYPACSLPHIVILPSGNTNLIANDLGFGMRGFEALTALERTPVRVVKERRAPLLVRWPGTERPPVLGMFQGSAAYARAIEIAHSPRVMKYAAHDLALAVTLVGALGSLALSGRVRRDWLQGEALSLSKSGAAPKSQTSFLFLATALSKLVYGVWPFWRGAGSVAEGINFLNVHAEPERLTRAIGTLMRGRAPAWLRASSDYESGRLPHLRVTSPGDFVLDGEVMGTGPHGTITIEAGPQFSFLRRVS